MSSWPPEWGRGISTNEAWILGPLIVRHVSIVWLDNPSTMTADQSESALVWRELLDCGSRPLILKCLKWVHPEFRSMVRRFPLFQRSPCWFSNVFNHMVWWKNADFSYLNFIRWLFHVISYGKFPLFQPDGSSTLRFVKFPWRTQPHLPRRQSASGCCQRKYQKVAEQQS